MKRTPLVRKTPLKRGTSELAKTPIIRRTRIRHRSAKMEKVYVERRPLVERLLRERPRCQFENCDKRSTEIHEILTRGRGGSILDEDNCLALCHDCHQYVTEHPKWAAENGYVKHSWDKDGDS